MYACRPHVRLKLTVRVVLACATHPLQYVSSMASRRGPSQAKEDSAIIAARMASEKARLQAAAEANRNNIAQQKREREEAEAAKAAADAAAREARKGARMPTPPPPRSKPSPKAPTYSAVEATPRSRTSTPPKRTTVDP